MTPTYSAAHDGHHHGAAAVDLSSVFGAAAAALSRRRIRARRTKRAREPVPVEPETREDDVPDPTSRRAAGAGPVPTGEPERVSRSAGAAAPPRRRRFGVVKVRDREHIDLLLLAAAAADGPVNGYELIDLVRERSDGLFELPLRVVVHQLHRLANNRLVQVVGDDRVRRYALTPLGERVLATRRREWEAFSHGLDRVLGAADDRDRRAPTA